MSKPLLFRILYFLRILKLFPQFYFHYEARRYIKRGDTVIDIGANQGIYTRIFSKAVGRFGLVYAIDPSGITYKNKNVIWFDCALGNKNDMAFLIQWRNTSGAYRLTNDMTATSCQIRKGSELFGDYSYIDFIKIDVEGSELPIIEDMAELILKHHPTILIETGEIDKVLSFLPGYKIKQSVNNDYLLI